MTDQYPTDSYLRLAAPWARRRFAQLLWLERRSTEDGVVLTERLKQLPQRALARSHDPETLVESARPGYLLCQDTYYVGTITGVGGLYLESVVDAFCSLAYGKLYLSKLPMTAVDVLNDRMLPFCREREVSVEHTLTDNSREFCGRPLHHAYELFLTIHQVDHRNTKVPMRPI